MTDQANRWAAVGEHIRRRMGELGMSQTELVQASGVSAFTVRRMMSGTDGNYQAAKTAKVCRALGWAPDGIDLMLGGHSPELGSPAQTLNDALAALDDPLGHGKAIEDHEQRLANLESLVERLMQEEPGLPGHRLGLAAAASSGHDAARIRRSERRPHPEPNE